MEVELMKIDFKDAVVFGKPEFGKTRLGTMPNYSLLDTFVC